MDRRQEMLLLREQKYTLQYIGDKFGISRERVRQIIGNTGVFYKYPFYRIEELIAVKKYFRLYDTELADLYGIPYTSFVDYYKLPYVSRYDPGYKKCYSFCKQVLPDSEFYSKKDKICKKCQLKRIGVYRNTTKQRELRRYKLSTPMGRIKARAYARVQNAKKSGKLVVGECEKKDRNCKGRIEANHWHGYDYEHALDVQWLCHYHHSITDKFGFKYIKH